MAIVTVLMETIKSADNSLTSAMTDVSKVYCAYAAELGLSGGPNATMLAQGHSGVSASWADASGQDGSRT